MPAAGAIPREPAHEHRGPALVGLPHQQLRRRGDLVGEPDLSDHEWTPFEVGPAAQIEQRRQPSGAQREPDGAVPPSAPDAVAHHHRQAHSEALLQGVAQPLLLASGSCGSSSTRSPSSAPGTLE